MADAILSGMLPASQSQAELLSDMVAFLLVEPAFVSG